MTRNPSVSSRRSFFGGDKLEDDTGEDEEVPVGQPFYFYFTKSEETLTGERHQ
jgi:hypothetical protein